MDFELIIPQTPWTQRTRIQFDTMLQDKYLTHLELFNNVSYNDSSQLNFTLWLAYGGSSSTGRVFTGDNHYRAIEYSQPRSYTDIWISTNNGLTWRDITDLTPKSYLLIACGKYDLKKSFFTILQRDIILVPDPDLQMMMKESINHYKAWESLVSQKFDYSDKKSCLNDDMDIYYNIGHNEYPYLSDIGHEWYKIDNIRPFRIGSITATHYNNTNLYGQNIRYVMGGSLVQPDGGEYHLHDLWASRDDGLTWIPILYEYPWNVDVSQISLTISRSGIMVINMVPSAQHSINSEIWASIDGGYTWGRCMENTSYGPREAGTLAFDHQGYLYFMGGIHFGITKRDVWKTQQPFDDLSIMSDICYLSTINRSIGLDSWPQDLRPIDLKLQPTIGKIALNNDSWIFHYVNIYICSVVLVILMSFSYYKIKKTNTTKKQ
jgi:hypothetical protein